MTGNETLESLSRLKVGDIISLSDAVTANQSVKAGKGFSIDYTIEKVVRVKNELAEWIFYQLKESELKICLMAKIVDDQIDIRVYQEVQDFLKGNRKDRIDQGDFWLFQEPADPDNFRYLELKYSAVLVQNLGNANLEFVQKMPEMDGICTEDPKPSGQDFELLATIAEYSASSKCDNPERMILEIGSAENEEGGLIVLLEGRNIAPSEVTVYNK